MARADTDAVSPEVGGISRREVIKWAVTFVVFCLTLGALAGFIWYNVVDLPSYSIQADGTGELDERETAAVFSIDAWFSWLGLFIGAGAGYIAWKWFRPLGWILVAIAAGGSLVAGIACWVVGVMMADDAMVNRIARAKVGDSVPIDFELHAPIALAVWCFAAMIPILALSALTPDPEEELLDA